MGELAATNQGRYPMRAGQAQAQNNGADVLPEQTGGVMGKPVTWWLVMLGVFILFIWIAKRFAPSEKAEFGNILPSFYNGIFLTLYIVLILNVLKVFAAKFKIPGLSEMILAA